VLLKHHPLLIRATPREFFAGMPNQEIQSNLVFTVAINWGLRNGTVGMGSSFSAHTVADYMASDGISAV
jgi:hypothetical protein